MVRNAASGAVRRHEDGASVTILTLNVWTEHTDLEKRMADTVVGIGELDPDIVFLQETVTERMRNALEDSLGQRYHIVCTNHFTPSFPLLAYIPCALVCTFTVLAYWWFEGVLDAYTLLAALVSLAFTSPQGLVFIARMILLREKQKRLHEQHILARVDLMGQAILIRRRSPTDAKAASHTLNTPAWGGFESKSLPFPSSIRGYPLPTRLLALAAWAFYWVQHCVFRPGLLMVQCTDSNDNRLSGITLCGVHLVISSPYTTTNPVRLDQVSYMHRKIKEFKAVTDSPANGVVVVAGDFNARDTSPEIDAMATAGYEDAAVAAKLGVVPDKRFMTWDNTLNAYTRIDEGTPDDRLDYIFLKGGSDKDANKVVITRTERVFDGIKMPIVSDHFGVLTRVTVR
eukprot:GFYU01003024.1.p1 GENE.GFYU01003024.1~~GFYU01003024.1.p1  ORF type:complete len:400 (+),score=65.98 GFYU01003024.1:80-1279(+)